MSGGYVYGESEPVEECGCCGGEARAEFCDVGVGYAQVSEFMCTECGAFPQERQAADGTWTCDWVRPPSPSERGEHVTGYLVRENGTVFETTFDEDHAVLYARMRTSLSALLSRGAARITNLEGYAIDLPASMPAKAKRALGRVVKEIGRREEGWGLPYVMARGWERGQEMTVAELMAEVSRLPESPAAGAEGPLP